ncbi:MAG: HAD family hydrolase [Senegalimassilia anaerobia]|nr:HAD family hydrolase [Senegalimassilia anaerobia]
MIDATTPRFNTFVFDLDGTLLDTLPDLVVLTNAVLRECGFPERTSAEILSYVGNGVKALMYQAVPQDADEEAVEAAMSRWKELYPQYGSRLTKAYAGIPETVAELKRRGARLGVLSNKFDAGVQDVVGAYLPGLFAVARGESADTPRKPDPTGLLRTIEELGSTPERTAYVGDSTGDIAVSRNAGTYAVAVTWGYHGAERLRAASADLVIDDPRALLDLLG